MQIDFSSSDVQSALIGASVGAVFAYVGGWWQSVRDRRRQRRAVATALLCEMYVAEDLARVLQENASPANITAHVPTQSIERFVEYASLFDPPVVADVMDLVRHTADLQRELSVSTHFERGHPRHQFMHRLADIVIRDVARVRPQLLKTGGRFSRASERNALAEPEDRQRRLDVV